MNKHKKRKNKIHIIYLHFFLTVIEIFDTSDLLTFKLTNTKWCTYIFYLGIIPAIVREKRNLFATASTIFIF